MEHRTFSCVAVASSHQGNRKYGHHANAQCVANCTSALAWMSLGLDFDTPAMDLILDIGHNLYVTAKPPNQVFLEPEEVTDRVIHFNNDRKVQVVLVEYRTGSMFPQGPDEMENSIQNLTTMLAGLVTEPSRNTGYLFTGQTVTICFFNVEDDLYLYDPHGVNQLRHHDFDNVNENRARLFKCNSLATLAKLLLTNAALDGGLREYAIHEVVLGAPVEPTQEQVEDEKSATTQVSPPETSLVDVFRDLKLTTLVPVVKLSRIENSAFLPGRPANCPKGRKDAAPLPVPVECEDSCSSCDNESVFSDTRSKGGRPKKRKRGGRRKTSSLSRAEQEREATKRYRERHRDQVKEAKKVYQESHPEVNRKAKKKYQETRPDVHREASQRYQDAHPEVHRKADRSYAETHREQRREAVRRFRARNPDLFAMRHIPAALSRLVVSNGPMGYWGMELLDFIQPFGLAKTKLEADNIFRCQHCGARLFEEEKDKKKWCCGAGAYNVMQLQPLTEPFYVNRQFLDRAKAYNDLFSFCALGIEGGYRHPSGLSFLKIEGRVYHTLSSLDNPGQRYRTTGGVEQLVNNCRLYLDDGEERRHLAEGRGLNGEVIDAILDCLVERNPLVGQFRMLSQEPSVEAHLCFEVTSRATHGPALGDRNPGLEVHAVLNTEPGPAEPRKVTIWKMGDRQPRYLDLFSPMVEPLQYPILYPDANAGWHIGRLDNFGRKLSLYDYARCLLLSEPRFARLGRLSQAWQVEMFARFEEERLRFIKRAQQRSVANNPNQMRIAPLNELQAHLAARGARDNSNAGGPQEGQQVQRDIQADETIQGEGGPQAGKIFLPSTFTGGPRYMKVQYDNSMALVTRKGPPSLFVTFTYSSTWKEHRENCDANGRIDPATACRIFKIYLNELLRDLRSGSIFGKPAYVVHVIEMQMRGLPHAHIVLRLEGGGPTQAIDIDKLVRADIPSEEEAGGRLRELVLRHMIHGPCERGSRFGCWDERTDKCNKFFPKPECQTTHADDRGFVHYKRSHSNIGYVRTGRRDIQVHDGWVVPYNPALLLKYQAHINVEIASTRRCVKYLFKYLRKGNSLQNMTIEFFRGEDEVKFYSTKRMIGASDACWRLLDFDITRSEPSVDCIPVHLEGQHSVVYRSRDAQGAVLKNTSKLLLYFGRPLDARFDDVTYQQFYENYIVHASRPRRGENAEIFEHTDGTHFVTPRLRGEKVCRIFWVAPNRGELYCLRLLLLSYSCRGYNDLLSLGGEGCTTFQEVARNLGLIDDDNEYDFALVEAATFMTAPRLRSFFVLLCNIEAPAPLLWERHWMALCEDYLERHPGQEERVKRLALIQIDRMLRRQGSTNQACGLPAADDDSNELGRELLAYGPIEQRQFVDEWEPRLSPDQRHVFDYVRALIADRDQLPELSRVVFLDGPGGYGKTLLVQVILAYVRGLGKVALASATSGVAAQNMPGGMTIHSLMRIPLDLGHGTGVWGLTNGSQRAQLIRAAEIIVFDEAPMAHRYLFEMVDRSMRDLMNCDEPFGGKVILCCGDFRQIPPVVEGARCPNEVIAVSLRASYLWRHFEVLHLTTPQRTRDDTAGYSDFLLSVGNGQLAERAFGEGQELVRLVPLPPSVRHVTSLKELIAFVYPLEVLRSPVETAKRAILATVNVNVKEFNDLILDRVEGVVHELLSVDTECREEGDDGADFEADVQLMNMATGKGVPDHKLRLKIGSVCLIMRNLNVAEGLVNGTKVIVTHISPRVVTVIKPGSDENYAIPRITFKFPLVEGSPLKINRRQFPLALAYAMSGHKSQGQTIDVVGVDFRTECFTHGQLYVLLSRVRSPEHIAVLVWPERVHDGIAYTKNIVYEDLLL